MPEQGGGKLIPDGICNPGQVYTVSPVSYTHLEQLNRLIDIGETASRKYDIVVTNPPYRAVADCTERLNLSLIHIFVMFFPGTYNEQELILFNEIKDDNYYRAFRLVK